MKVLVAGDFCPTGRLIEKLENRDFSSIFKDVAPIVKSADYAIVNYECPVVSGQYAPIKKNGPNLTSTRNALESIRYAGFDMVTLANNHIMDYGEGGLNDTIDACRVYDIDTVGAGKNLEDASRVAYVKRGRECLAILNCCEHEFSIAGEQTAGANPLNSIQQFYKIQEARKNADYVLVIVHGGHEYFQLPSPRMVETYRFFVDAGADVVVNHHQHCFSGYERYKDKFIFYGLGNFCFDKEKANPIWHEGFLLALCFEYGTVNFDCIPYVQCLENPDVKLVSDIGKWKERVMELNDIISDRGKLENACALFYADRGASMKSVFEPYEGRVLRALYRRGFLPSFFGKKKMILKNLVECESHRDVMFYMLNH